MQIEERIIYELYDTNGKVMETMDEEKALIWKIQGEEKRMRDGSKSRWVRRRHVNVRVS